MKYYAVKVGVKPGVYRDWESCKAQVNGYKGAIYKAFLNVKEAEAFIDGVTSTSSNTTPHLTSNKTSFIPLHNSIFVDGGHNKLTGDEAWGSVTDHQGKDMLYIHKDLLKDMELRGVHLPVGDRIIIVSKFLSPNNRGRISLLHRTQNISSKVKEESILDEKYITQAGAQNNGAELLALIAGLRIALLNTSIRTIYSDSSCILFWSISLGESQRATFDPRKVRYIDELIMLRKEFESLGGTIEKISGDDNLADLGYHK